MNTFHKKIPLTKFSVHLDTKVNFITPCGEEKLSCSIPKTVLRIQTAELAPLEPGMCSTSASTIDGDNDCAQSYLKSKYQVLEEIKSMCEGVSECNVSVKSISSDPCPFEPKYINVLLQCLMRRRAYPGKILVLTLRS